MVFADGALGLKLQATDVFFFGGILMCLIFVRFLLVSELMERLFLISEKLDGLMDMLFIVSENLDRLIDRLLDVERSSSLREDCRILSVFDPSDNGISNTGVLNNLPFDTSFDDDPSLATLSPNKSTIVEMSKPSDRLSLLCALFDSSA